MIVLRLLCDGILKGWNQDPAYTSYLLGTIEPLLFSSPSGESAFSSSLN
jgi:hypothetical protein